jgi:hypothetical protein
MAAAKGASLKSLINYRHTRERHKSVLERLRSGVVPAEQPFFSHNGNISFRSAVDRKNICGGADGGFKKHFVKSENCRLFATDPVEPSRGRGQEIGT